MRIQDFRGRKTAIWGLGREGWSVLHTLRRELPDLPLSVLNDSELGPDERERLSRAGNVDLCTGQGLKERLFNFDVVIKSPGVSLYRPEIDEARQKGVVFTSSTNIWFAERPGETTVCVTGTKGKSTTSSLVAHMLAKLGRDCALAGNVGVPIISMVDQAADIWVFELSSYQTADFKGSPTVSVLLDLYPEHLDWHEGVDRYYRDKLHLFTETTEGWSVVNRTDPVAQGIPFTFNRPVYFNGSDGLHTSDGWVLNGAKRLVSSKNVPLLGEHNLSNLCAALTVVGLLGGSLEEAVKTLATFTPLPHRLTPIGVKKDILYVDDSISTTPQSTIEAIKTFSGRSVTILLGGFDRGLDFSHLALFLTEHPVNAVITLPESGARIAEAIQKVFAAKDKVLPPIVEASDLTQAVGEARNITPSGGVILLSPASPSYGRFKNFEERGEAFKKAAGFA